MAGRKYFTFEEKALVTELCLKYPAVTTVASNGNLMKLKNRAWEALTDDFNSNAHVKRRTPAQLKKLVDNMKVRRKAALAAHNQDHMKIGCSPMSVLPPLLPPPPLIPLPSDHHPLEEFLVQNLNTEILDTKDCDKLEEVTLHSNSENFTSKPHKKKARPTTLHTEVNNYETLKEKEADMRIDHIQCQISSEKSLEALIKKREELVIEREELIIKREKLAIKREQLAIKREELQIKKEIISYKNELLKRKFYIAKLRKLEK